MQNQLPNNWPMKKIGEVTEIYGGGTPRRTIPEYWGNDVPWLTFEDTNNLNVMGTIQHISNQGLQNSNAQLIPAGSVNLSCTASVGNVTINRIPLATNQQFNSFHPHKELIPEFLAYELMYRKNEIINLGGTTTIPFVSKTSIFKFQIHVPKIDTQKKISMILSSVDEAIQKTDQIIQESKELKNGLMNELLTKGIGHKKFKKTKLGEIPEEWDLIQLGRIVEVKGGKRLPKGTPFAVSKTTHPYIRIVDFKNLSIDPTELKYIDEATHKVISKYVISKDDVYISIAGTIGIVGLIPDVLNGANLTENAAKIVIIERITKEYLSYYLASPLGQNQITNLTVKTTQPKLALNKIEQIIVPIPSVNEQNQIIQIISKLHIKEKAEIEKKQKLILLKSGLMQDIFSQKVEVN